MRPIIEGTVYKNFYYRRMADFANDAWQLQGFWVLTGEDGSYRGVKPSRNFDPLAGGWGAWELVSEP